MQEQHSFTANQDKGILYLVPTPIGNLDDMTFRAIKTLKEADLIAAENPSHTQQLLNHFEIDTKKISFREDNKDYRIDELVQTLNDGQNVAQVSDAGMPSISDPGQELVKACVDNNINVVPLPGANAGLTALIASGLVPQPFYFFGFLNRKNSDQISELEELNQHSETLIFYEAPHRLNKTLKNMQKVFGADRQAVLCRELTKKFEEFDRGSISELIEWTEANQVRGEFVVIVDGNKNSTQENQEQDELAGLSIQEQVDLFIGKGMKTNAAIKEVAKLHKVKKQEIYNIYHEI
ncbi:S-adenosylmethionine-dependent methyltransferase, YraL family [Apilactobacillus kunkeei DSM 12361 = ATCC 700308]|uniref:Ribosomal RNA small subunit methyltransferase I n=1 Tax=Apilactobacillus kunkeei DSM 12361 = ATCC 700308 TaxID=1423768 RepID=A0A0R1FTS7_9LACO|nr:16S rRNA (cytidine(1402)-2'-O)-methyltransferase [Apilactobacillus kunkeei]KOY73508.1 Ribosomal RNA small subunit methyltransferase I [Apilactobacillus kunkeei DSM 12361 = ATCC 700308]KRK25099.1 S-adenosylmethionine-dependent methyltransferase, YraL family [Apilactobacillus kunkeei DSM 12361 = ATCC 700308]MCK8620606.1 16S rRNA (cytidine(1402)-2'-O)-methyltransferase [Apilactobacillus kunkeei]QYU53421.1 16S rRNA (cytidine(1402)-2'-O)-methyltransferase [Apilactobacillus kunkeei]